MAIETLFKYKGNKNKGESFLIDALKNFNYFYTEEFQQYTLIFRDKYIWGHYFIDDVSSSYHYFDVKYESAFRSTPEDKRDFIEIMLSFGFEVDSPMDLS